MDIDVTTLTDTELLLLSFQAEQDLNFGDHDEDVDFPGSRVYVTSTYGEVVRRFKGREQAIVDYAMDTHASIEDLIRIMHEKPDELLSIIYASSVF